MSSDEPAIRSSAVTWPTGGTYDNLLSEQDRLLYAARGAMQVTTEIGAWIVPPQHALWVPGGIRHCVRMSGPASLRIVYFEPEVVAGLPRDCRAMKPGPLLRELILHLARNAIVEWRRGPGAHAIALLVDEIAHTAAMPLQLPMPADARLQRASRLLATPAGTRLPLEVIAGRIAASPRTLQRLFVRETGLTFERWRTRERLVRAVALLSDRRKVSDVAFQVGYDSTSAFIAMFRKELGTTPSQYFGDRLPDA